VTERLGWRENQRTDQGYRSLGEEAASESWEKVPTFHVCMEACEQNLVPWMPERGWRLSLQEDTGACQLRAAWCHEATGRLMGHDALEPSAGIRRAFLVATRKLS
jgi:hypothetical protein